MIYFDSEIVNEIALIASKQADSLREEVARLKVLLNEMNSDAEFSSFEKSVAAKENIISAISSFEQTAERLESAKMILTNAISSIEEIAERQESNMEQLADYMSSIAKDITAVSALESADMINHVANVKVGETEELINGTKQSLEFASISSIKTEVNQEYEVKNVKTIDK